YLDEVADMPRETQGRILRVLVEQRFRRVGGDQDVQVDVRVVSSTSPERREDIPELVEYFIDKIAEATGMPRRRLADDALATLQVRAWPGNLRQLRNNVE